MEKHKILAERRLFIKNCEEDFEQELILRIGYPYWIIENEEAACPIEIDGLFNSLKNQKIHDVRGIDFLQAIESGLSFFNYFLANLPKKYEIYWNNGESYMNMINT